MTGPTLEDVIGRITRPDDDPVFAAAAAEARQRWDGRAKPHGALGQLEALGVRVAGVTGTCPPHAPRRPSVVVFAADHGVVEDGPSAWPSDVTGWMVRTMATGGAAVNALARTVGAEVTLVDVGVASDLSDVDGIVHARVREGTSSLARGPAMTRDDALAALAVGIDLATERIAGGADLLVGGDMGIGNTTASSALIAHHTGRRGSDAAAVVGSGAGSTGDRLARKRAIVVAAVDRAVHLSDPVAVLAEIGGLEIAALAGFHLAAAAARLPVVVDGVIGCAALCVAEALAPGTAARTIAGHRSSEPAASAALAHLGLRPLLELDLRLGEGTGACLAVPLVQAACRALHDMAELPS